MNVSLKTVLIGLMLTMFLFSSACIIRSGPRRGRQGHDVRHKHRHCHAKKHKKKHKHRKRKCHSHTHRHPHH